MALSLTVLGCDGSHPQAGGACSGYLVRSPSTTLWVDAGSGTMANLQEHVGLADVDAMVLSHEHPDHWRDVEGMHIALRYHVKGREVPVFAPKGLGRLAYPTADRMAPELRFTAIAGPRSPVRVGDLTLRFARTDHGPPTFAVRIDADGGGTIAYSSDTGPRWSLSDLGEGIDLALVEATYERRPNDVVKHLTGAEAGRAAREAGARLLVVTHFGFGEDRDAITAQASEAFGAEATRAAPHLEVTL